MPDLTRLGSPLSAAIIASGCLASPALAAEVTHLPLFEFRGPVAGESFGFSVAGAGDVDNDGRDDVIVGAVDTVVGGQFRGSARVYSGRTGGLLREFLGNSANDQFGFSVDGAGDLDGDGHDDVIVGAIDDAGAGTARVFSGRTGGELLAMVGQSTFDALGWSVAGLGDASGDGVPDVAAGVPYANGLAGRARIASGANGSNLLVIDGGQPAGAGVDGGFLGYGVGGAGDIDGDGLGDLVVGIPREDTNGRNAGSARVVSAVTGQTLLEVFGSSEGDSLGFSVDGAGDVDGDGRDDVVVGVNGDDAGGNNAGGVHVYSGRTGSLLLDATGPASGAFLGQSVAGLGDVDGDGHADVIAGMPGSDAGGVDTGGARVYSGSDGSVLYDLIGQGGGDRFGWSVGGAGDVNGDGLGDFVIGAEAGGAFDEGYVLVYASRLVGDANGDGAVDLADFGILRANFGQAGTFDDGDFDQDGTIGLADFGRLRANFGASLTAADLAMLDAWAASVPEPATASLLASLAGLAVRRRRS